MRIGIVSDVHCNAATLRAAFDAMSDVDEIFCAGDLVFDYRFSNEVLDLIREREVTHVLGNHDAHVIGPAGERIRASGQCDPDHLAYLAGTPRELWTSVGGKTIYMVHGSPWDPLHEYLYPHSAKIPQLAEVETDYLLLGHTHVAMIKQVGPVTVINPGSVGDPRDRSNGRLPTYAVLDVDSGDCVVHSIESG